MRVVEPRGAEVPSKDDRPACRPAAAFAVSRDVGESRSSREPLARRTPCRSTQDAFHPRSHLPDRTGQLLNRPPVICMRNRSTRRQPRGRHGAPLKRATTAERHYKGRAALKLFRQHDLRASANHFGDLMQGGLQFGHGPGVLGKPHRIEATAQIRQHPSHPVAVRGDPQ